MGWRFQNFFKGRRQRLNIHPITPATTTYKMADDGMLLNFEVPSDFTAPKPKFRGGSWKDRLTARKSAEYGRNKAAERARANVSTVNGRGWDPGSSKGCGVICAVEGGFNEGFWRLGGFWRSDDEIFGRGKRASRHYLV